MCVSKSLVCCFVVALVAEIWSKRWTVLSYMPVSLAVVASNLKCACNGVSSWWVEWNEVVRFHAYGA